MKVPKFNQYFPTETSMNSLQKKFYKHWRTNWEKGKKVDIKNQISYIFCYIYDILSVPFSTGEDINIQEGVRINITICGKPVINGLKKDYKTLTKEVIRTLNRIIDKYQEEEKLVWYCKRWLSDCFVLVGDYKKALNIYPKLFVGKKAEYPTTTLLNLKLFNNKNLSGYDILTLNGAKVTNFGKRNIDKVAQYLEILIRKKEKKEKKDLLKEWMGEKESYNIFNGSFCAYSLPEVPYYLFTHSPHIKKEIQKLTREAEDTVREEMSIPRVGEGWIAETELYYKMKEVFPSLEIVHHARPKWLGKQHLDIYIPKKKVAIEYQGRQHYKPIDFFGGEKAFEATKKRDKIKKQRCIKNKIKLIEVSEDYDISQLIKQI